jgi:hypothetical protein
MVLELFRTGYRKQTPRDEQGQWMWNSVVHKLNSTLCPHSMPRAIVAIYPSVVERGQEGLVRIFSFFLYLKKGLVEGQ